MVIRMSLKNQKFGQGLLDSLYRPENSDLLSQLNERRYKKRHILFMPHSKEDLVFIVKEGKLRVYLGLDGKELSLVLLGPGDIYTSHTRAYVVAMEDSVVLTCPVFKFYTLATKNQGFSLPLFMSLGKLLSGSISLIENLYFYDIDKRVAAYFYEEALVHGDETDDGLLVHVGLTVDNIATIVGSSRQTVSSLISGMEKDGILKKVARGEYLVKNMDELKYLAHPCPE